MSENFDLFGGIAIEDIPETNDLPAGKYEEIEIETIKAQRTKANTGNGIGVTFKDVSEDGFGLTAFKWIAFPVPANRAQYLLKDLKSIGLKGEALREFAMCVKGTDPETAEVDFNRMNDVLADSKGLTGTLEISTYINKNTKKEGTNVVFTPNEDSFDDGNGSNDAVSQSEPKANVDTDAWFKS